MKRMGGMYMKYNWEAYNIKDEVIGGGTIYAADRDMANKKIEKELDDNEDDWTEAGYFNHRIVSEE